MPSHVFLPCRGKWERSALSLLAFALLSGTALVSPEVKAQSFQAAPAQMRQVAGTINIAGTGATPLSQISLNNGSSANLTVQAREDGSFSFLPIGYDFQSPLVIKFTAAVSNQKQKNLNTNTLVLKLDPDSYTVYAEGSTTKAASVALNIGTASSSAIANKAGYFKIQANSAKAINPANTRVVLSVINVDESCCPPTALPVIPLTIALHSTPIAKTQASGPALETTTGTTTPRKNTPAPIFLPYDDGALTRGSVVFSSNSTTSDTVYASYSTSWGQGLRRMSDKIVGTIMLQAEMFGGFIDAKNHLRAQLALQKLRAQAHRDYKPSESMCQFGTLSKAVAASDERGQANKLVLAKVMRDRDTMRKFSLNSSSVGVGETSRMLQFQKTFCDKSDEFTGLKEFCDTSSDLDLNRDIDYTRVIDVPLTIDVNFVDNATADQKRNNASIIAMANNLFATEAFPGLSYDDFAKSSDTLSDDLQDYRALVAARSVARNAFAHIVGMKSSGSANSGTYLPVVLKQMGLSDQDAKRVLGTNPSYFAQMETLTKKIYLDPAFFAHLYDSPANIERQRAAMKGVALQQESDVIELLKMREMLLATLLELKIRNQTIVKK